MDTSFWVILGALGYLLATWVTITAFIAWDGPGGNDDPMLYFLSFLWPVAVVILIPYGFCKSAFLFGKRIHENRHPESIMVKDDD